MKKCIIISSIFLLASCSSAPQDRSLGGGFEYIVQKIESNDCSDGFCRSLTISVSVENNESYDICIPNAYLTPDFTTVSSVRNKSSGYSQAAINSGIPNAELSTNDLLVREEFLRRGSYSRISTGSTKVYEIDMRDVWELEYGQSELIALVEYFNCDQNSFPSLSGFTMAKEFDVGSM